MYSDNASQLLAQMHKEILDSLRDELRAEFQSRFDDLESEFQFRIDDLETECDMLKQKQLEDDAKISQLEKKVNSLQRKAKYLEVFIENQQWEYSAPIPTIAELISLGYNENDADYIVSDIFTMKGVTRNIRMGNFLEHIHPNLGATTIENFYQGYLPHYREFADALIEYRHAIEYMESDDAFLGDESPVLASFCVSLGNTPLPREVLVLLQEIMQYTHFHHLIFNRNNLHGVGYVDFIANCVWPNTRLKVLDLNEINFEHTREIDVLCDAINCKNSLEVLKLVDCNSDEGILRYIFYRLKSRTLRRIQLHGGNLSNLRPTDMSVFLSSNPALRLLKLGSIPFNREDITYFADALRNNTTLRKLSIGVSPGLSPNYWHHIEPAVFNRTSLNATHDSNHFCSIEITHTQTFLMDKFNKYNDPVKNRRKKIYYILSIRNRRRENAAYLESNGINIKHIPRILALLKLLSEHHLQHKYGSQDECEVKPLSIAFEIMRDWKIPELYNNLDPMEED